MSNYTLKNGIVRRIASVPEEGHETENAVTVVAAGGTIPWVLRFWARLGVNSCYAGAVRIFPSKNHRVVAICSLPGARAWEVEGRGATNAPDELLIHFEGQQDSGGPYGVRSIPGNSIDGARSYRVERGTAGVVVVTGEVFGWAAHAAVAGATVGVTANPGLAFGPIDVPINGAVNGNAQGMIAPISTWTFTNTAGFFIEYVAPGTNYDG
jgi:hypothetical protein